MATTSEPTARYSSRPEKTSRSRSRSSGVARFTGMSWGKRYTSNSSATDMLTICLRTREGCAFLDQENSSMARYTSIPRSRISWTIPLWLREKGSKVPGKKAALAGM